MMEVRDAIGLTACLRRRDEAGGMPSIVGCECRRRAGDTRCSRERRKLFRWL